MKRFLVSIIIQVITTTTFAYEAHEWGTFTSLVGANGQTQDGMYHEDEELPDFVHGFGETQLFPNPFPDFGDCNNLKVCFNPQVFSNNVISQKMETPVIYFYGNQVERVQVNVDFPEGIITETFPAPTSSSPQNSEDLVIADGKAQFDIEIMPMTGVQPPNVENGNIYGHARNVNSTMIRSNQEYEKFIFYRGLGRFYPRLHISSEDDNLSVIVDDQFKPHNAFLVFKREGQLPSLMSLMDSSSPVTPQQIAFNLHRYVIDGDTISGLKGEHPASDYVSFGGNAFDRLTESLQQAGLKKDEAQAMVATWENGYFHTPGLRMLYILPKHEVDDILPLKMTPAPQELERVFVARIELMLEVEELELVTQIMEQKLNFDIQSQGRMAEPRLRRARQVYQEQHMKIQSDIANFQYGLTAVFDDLVKQSQTLSSPPLGSE